MTQPLAIIPDSKELVRQSTDIASLCKQIVVASAVSIQGRKYVRVEGWQAIATAHGCVASARDVKRVEGGTVATGEIRRMQDGQLIATAEGFVGEDEPVWYGGKSGNKILAKRPEYAIRAMAQTRAISRACRGCFAHVVVLMDAGLSTTPAEEVPEGGFVDNFMPAETSPEPAQETDGQRKKREFEALPEADQKAKAATWFDPFFHERAAALLIEDADYAKSFAAMASNGTVGAMVDLSLNELLSVWPKRKEIDAELTKVNAKR